jgi:hypothetical protein
LRIAASVGSIVEVGVAISAGVDRDVEIEMDVAPVEPHPARPRAAAPQRNERSWAS